MKLEIKHLTPYLPYDLKVVFEGDEHEHTLVGLVNWANEIMVLSPFSDYGRSNIKNCKPILRPLSDLTINEYWNLSGKDKNKEFGFWYGKDVNGEYLHFEGYTSRQIRKDQFKTLPHYAFEFLIENHFDVFGLIEKGLAIDINELKH